MIIRKLTAYKIKSYEKYTKIVSDYYVSIILITHNVTICTCKLKKSNRNKIRKKPRIVYRDLQ